MSRATNPEEGAQASEGPCRRALASIYEYLDGALEDASHAVVAEHFRICARCYPHLVLERSFRDAVKRALESQAAPSALRAAVEDALARESR